VGPCTIASYRDAFSLLLHYAEHTLDKTPSALELGDLNESLLIGFLHELETGRGNAVRARNARRAAIRSFLHFASRRDVTHLATVTQTLSVPMKRFERSMLGFLTREQTLAVLALPGTDWLAVRDRLLLQLLYNTWARVSVMVAVRVDDVVTADGACVHLRGKGRKRHSVSLWNQSAKLVRAWLALDGAPMDSAPLLPTRTRDVHDASERVTAACHRGEHATERYPELATLDISPRTILRHTTAMHLLQSGVVITVIALWLGHGSPATTHHYVEADLAMKEKALARLQAPAQRAFRYQPPDSLIGFLRAL
jgi:site-specific recombinase XerD